MQLYCNVIIFHVLIIYILLKMHIGSYSLVYRRSYTTKYTGACSGNLNRGGIDTVFQIKL